MSTRGYRKPKQRIVIPERVAQRAALKFVKDGDCYVSTYSVASHGYAQIGWNDPGYRQVVTAHRAAWVYYTGRQIPEGMTIDHLCRNRRCIRREHLRMLTNYENARRTSGRDWPLGECVNGHPNSMLRKSGSKWVCSECNREWRKKYDAKRPKSARRTAWAKRPPRPRVLASVCPNGHPYSPENTYIRPQGWRECRACKRAARRVAKGKREAA